MRRILVIAILGIVALVAVAARRRSVADAELADPLDALATSLPPVDELTRDELYAWARRLDIPRRSRMRKAELADAVRERAETPHS